MSNAPPVSLKKLYDDLDFLSGIKDRQKYCFSKRYYTNLSWLDYVWRKLDGENQDVNGIAAMETICMDAGQQFETYHKHPIFGIQLLDKMVSARHGLQRCSNTYDSLQRTVTASSIKNRGILLLDNTIPYDRKVREGIVLIADISEDNNGRQRVLSTSNRESPEARSILNSVNTGSTGVKSYASSPPIISNLIGNIQRNTSNSDLVEEEI